MKNQDSPPIKAVNWFKFPWVLLWLLPSLSVVSGLTMLGIALTHKDDLVTDAYYKEGMSYNRKQQSDLMAREQKISAQLMRIENQFIVLTKGIPEDSDISQLSLRVMHPTDKAQDIQVLLHKTSGFQYEASHPFTEANHWYLELNPPDGSWRLRGKWDGKSLTELRPEIL